MQVSIVFSQIASWIGKNHIVTSQTAGKVFLGSATLDASLRKGKGGPAFSFPTMKVHGKRLNSELRTL